MSEVVLSFRGRQIHVADVLFLRELIAHNRTLSRFRLSLHGFVKEMYRVLVVKIL